MPGIAAFLQRLLGPWFGHVSESSRGDVQETSPPIPCLGLELLEPRLLFSGEPALLLPDIIPLASEENHFLYGWEEHFVIDSDTRLLSMSVVMANIGDGPMEIWGEKTFPDGTQRVFQRIYDDQGGFTRRRAGRFVFHDSHHHLHFDEFAAYNLVNVTPDGGVGDIVAGGSKVSFCLRDSTIHDPGLPGAPSTAEYNCGIVQGISVGWADVYNKFLPDQWIDITGVPDNIYWLEVITDPQDRLRETDETNNVVRILVNLTDDHSDKAEGATAAGFSESIAGEREHVGDNDWFSFAAEADTDYQFEVDLDTLAMASLDLYAEDATTLLASDESNVIGTGPQIDWRAPEGGIYFLEVGHHTVHAGTYELHLSVTVPLPSSAWLGYVALSSIWGIAAWRRRCGVSGKRE